MISNEIVNTCDFGSGSANNESQNEEDRGHDVVVVCYTEDKKKKFGLKRERTRGACDWWKVGSVTEYKSSPACCLGEERKKKHAQVVFRSSFFSLLPKKVLHGGENVLRAITVPHSLSFRLFCCCC